MRPTVLLLAALSVAGCDGPFRTPWHAERLPSGTVIKVTAFELVWGNEPDHPDDHTLGGDCLSMEYVMADPNADASRREAEARQAFDALARTASEQWQFRSAELLAFRQLERKGRYDFYEFERASDGQWSFRREERKVFATD